MSVGVVEVVEDRLLIRHGDAEAVDGQLAHAMDEVLERLGVQGEIDGVHVLPAQRRVHDRRREGMFDGIARYAVNTGGGVHLLDPVNAAELRSTDLAGRSFLIGADGGKGENAAGAHVQYAADDALLSHTQADQRMAIALCLEKLHHGDVVGERGRGGDELVKLRRNRPHLFQRGIEIAGGSKIVERKNQGGTRAQARHGFRLGPERTLEFQIQQLASGGRRLAQNLQL